MLKFPFLVSLVLIAAVFDLRWRRIPNWLTAFGWSFGVMLQGLDAGWTGVRDAFLGTGLALSIYVTLFALRAMGGGDVKLMAAVGAFTGPWQWLSVFLLTALVGGAFALATVWTRGEATRAAAKVGTILWELMHLRAPHKADAELDVSNLRARTLPHGAAIAAGTLLLLIYNSSR